MKYLIFGKFSLNHIYFLFYAVFVLVHKIIKDNLKGDKIAKNFFYLYLVVLSRLLSIVPYLIYKKLSKTNKDEKRSKSIINITYRHDSISKIELKKKIAKSTFIVAIFEFIAEIFQSIFFFLNKESSISNYQLEIFLVFNTVTQYFASFLILNYQFYKHHYLSFGINLGCLVISLIVDIIELIRNKISHYQFYIFALLKMLKQILMAIKDSYSKKVLYKEYLSTFTLMLISGLYELLFLAIFSVPFIFLKSRDSQNIIFIDFLKFLKGTNLILSICTLICKFAFTLFLLIIIDKFSPSHLPLAFLLYSFLYNIYMIINNSIKNVENEYYLFLNFVFYAILFIGAMIHNEIIIINTCGFNNKTKMFLDMKLDEEKKDYQLPNDDENEVSDNQSTLSQSSILKVELVSQK